MAFDDILVTAPGFRCDGGWVLDTQFIPNMGMPYLLAHGLGRPVEDAVADFAVETAGEYHLFVYTFNWVAPWKKAEAPGLFDLLIDGRKAGPTFGGESPAWGWERGGNLSLAAGAHTLVLRDLTGFEGRFGMALLTRDPAPRLPDTAEAVRAMVLERTCGPVTETESYDLVVCGAGIAGICAALAAARSGLKTALIQDRPLVGGNNSSEVRVWLGGETHFEPFPGIGNIVNELEQTKVGHHGPENAADNYEDGKKLALLEAEERLTLYLGHAVTDVEMEGERIGSVTAWDYRGGRCLRIPGALFADCTGDATVGALAGADYEMTANGHMGMSNLWYAEECDEPQSFPACPWAVDLSRSAFPGREGVDQYGLPPAAALGAWFWESGCEHDPILRAEYTRDLNFRAMYGAWDALKNRDGAFPNHRLGFCAYIAGKRESRRLLGDVILTKSDVRKGAYREDGCVPSTWTFDVHYPDKRFYASFHEGDAFIAEAYQEPFHKPYFIPYRALYSRNVPNMFMAGRNVSVSHEALGTVRVMRTGGMMGEVVGYAAALCRRYEILPREVYEGHLEEFMAELRSIPRRKLTELVANA